MAERQPEILARHCTDAGQIAESGAIWGAAGQRSLGRSAVAEASEQCYASVGPDRQLTLHPDAQARPIQLQVAASNALMHG